MSFLSSIGHDISSAVKDVTTVGSDLLHGNIGGAIKTMTSPLLSTINKAVNAVNPSSNTNTASVDPFAPYRSSYINQLNGLMTPAGGAALTSLPGYATAAQQTGEATARQMNASGFGNSGNMLYALSQAGNNLGTQAYNSQFGLLESLSGANQFSPSGIASAQVRQSQMAGGVLGTGATIGAMLL